MAKVTDEKRVEIHKLLDVYIDALAELKSRPKSYKDSMDVLAKTTAAQDKFHEALFNI